MTAFTIDTDEYYRVGYKVNDAKTFKNLAYYFVLANHHVGLYYRLVRLTVAFKIIAINFQCCIYQVSLKRYQIIYMCWILFICKWSTSYIESITQSGSPKKNICWYGTQKLPKNLNIYLHNYQTETAIFLATKHEKTIMACSYLNFSIQKIHQNSKKWWLLWGIA